jgi:hypothetical protein
MRQELMVLQAMVRKQDVVTQMELSIDLSFSVAPSSVVDETIMAFALI